MGDEALLGGTVGTSTRCDIAQSYTKVAGALALTGNNPEASTFYSKALEPLASAKPPNVLALYAASDAYFGMGELAEGTARQAKSVSKGVGKQHRLEACDWYRKSADAWRQIPNPARVTPSGFTTRDPRTAVKSMHRCKAS